MSVLEVSPSNENHPELHAQAKRDAWAILNSLPPCRSIIQVRHDLDRLHNHGDGGLIFSAETVVIVVSFGD